MKNPLIYHYPRNPRHANIKNRKEGQEQRHKTKSNRNPNEGKRQRREKTQKLINGEWPRKLEKRPYQESISTYKSTKVLPTPIPHSASIYGRRIYLVTKKERYKGKKAERQIRVMIKHQPTANERVD